MERAVSIEQIRISPLPLNLVPNNPIGTIKIAAYGMRRSLTNPGR